MVPLRGFFFAWASNTDSPESLSVDCSCDAAAADEDEDEDEDDDTGAATFLVLDLAGFLPLAFLLAAVDDEVLRGLYGWMGLAVPAATASLRLAKIYKKKYKNLKEKNKN